MFKCGDKVFYGIHGICEIVDVEIKKIDKKNVEYFVLQPFGQTGVKFYVPIHNELALSKLRPILTANEINELLIEETKETDSWIADEGQRKLRYKQLISGGDRAALLRMIHALYRQRQRQQSLGRKLHLCDENFLRDAEKLLSVEFSVVLNIRQDEVAAYVQKALTQKSDP